VFDGIHLGHQKILRKVVERANALGAVPTVITHDPHPLSVVRPEMTPPLLQTLEQRLEGLKRLGIEQTIVIEFTPEYAKTTAEEFLREIVFGQLNAQEIYIGEGASFGQNRQGRIELVVEMGQALGRYAAQVDEVRYHGRRVRSTIIRQALKARRVNLVRKMLRQPYELVGTVMKGRGLGQELLFPTANLAIENDFILAQGVYITLAQVHEQWYPSATNIGIRPTFGGDAEVSVECHLLDFHQNLLGQRLRLRFLHRLRNEKRFSGIEALKQQIEHDLNRTRIYFNRAGVKAALESVLCEDTGNEISKKGAAVPELVGTIGS
jgi:riboflavin kinase/FMN adenylyltransferase